MAVAAAFVLAPLSAWFAMVDREVTQPYLDEFFHVRQAQHYCDGRFDIWDPKITTPPGVYLLSYFFSPAIGCSITALRLVNAACLLGLLAAIYMTYVVRRQASHESGIISGIAVLHSSVNMVLFPPIFFFAALYYTDIASTLSVVLCYLYFIRNPPDKPTTVSVLLCKTLLGLMSLMFRQTNLFWVAVAPAALTLIVELDRGTRLVKESMYRHAEGFGDNFWNIAKTTWRYDAIYDPPMRDVYFEDYIRTCLSIVVCGVKVLIQPKRLVTILLALLPYLTIMISFAGFVLWNGGVVLGDKSNHVATINLPQMLYVWPYMVFFSWPMMLSQMLLLPLMVTAQLSRMAHFEPLLFFRRRYFLPRTQLVIIFTLLAAVIVHFNTVIHPFMLADNRHYPFYVFRRLLRPGWVRYAVCPVYVVCAWACLETRGETPSNDIGIAAHQNIARRNAAAADAQATDGAGKRNATAQKSLDQSQPQQIKRPLRLADGKSTATVSFFLVALITMALQLCTAPLFEPRYCILPWLIWRLHLPLHTTDSIMRRSERASGMPASKTNVAPKPTVSWSFSITSWMATSGSYDHRLILETLWFLGVNAVTAYIFLHWTFVWPQEPGQLQRFMW